MLASLGLLAALVAPGPSLPPSPTPPPARVAVVEARLTGLEIKLRVEAPPSRLRDLARVLVVRARGRLGAGDFAAADQLGAAASDALHADGPLLLLVMPGPDGPPLPRGPFGPMVLPNGPLPPRSSSAPVPPADPERAARHLDRAATMLAMTGGFAERGDAARLLSLAREALDRARRALAADDPAAADGGARRAETLARAALHAAIADDPGLRMLPFPVMRPLPRHAPPAPPGMAAPPVVGAPPGSPGELP